jgi:hypothetical protein
MLGGNELVAELARVLLGLIENLVQLTRKSRGGVRLFRISAGFTAGVLEELVHTDAELVEDGGDDPLVLLEEGEEEVEVVDDRISGAPSVLDGVADGFGGFDG